MFSIDYTKKKMNTNEIKLDCQFENVEIAPEFIEWAEGSKSYIEWLNKQKDRKDSLGNLLRKFLTDKNITSWYGFRSHLDNLGATEDEIKTCEKSWVEYTIQK